MSTAEVIGDLPMSILSCRDFSKVWWDAAPAEQGVYAVMFGHGEALLDRCGYYDIADHRPTWIGEEQCLLANVGCTSKLDLSRRLNHHLWGDSRVSSLRRTVAVLWAPRWIRPHGEPGAPSYHFGEQGEAWITGFIQRHGHFAWCPTQHPARKEFELIGRLQPALNIKGLERLAWTKHLLALRRSWADAART